MRAFFAKFANFLWVIAAATIAGSAVFCLVGQLAGLDAVESAQLGAAVGAVGTTVFSLASAIE